MAALTNLQCSACFFTSDDVELFFRHDCVDNSGTAAPPMVIIVPKLLSLFEERLA